MKNEKKTNLPLDEPIKNVKSPQSMGGLLLGTNLISGFLKTKETR